MIMDLANMSLKEIEALEKTITQAKEKKLEQGNRERKDAAKEFNQFLIDNRDVILNLVEHSKSDCNGDNGYCESEESICPKCLLKEILDGVWYLDEFEIKFNIEIVDLDKEVTIC